MRLSAVPALFFACLTLAGCTSSIGPDTASTGVDNKETTGSVARPMAPVPSANVGGKTTRLNPNQNMLSVPGAMPERQVLVPPQAFGEERTLGMPVPSNRPLAMLSPNRPAPDMPPLRPTAGPRERMHIYSRQFRDAKPINFGRVSPKNYAVHGVDISRWQGNIDWAQLRTQGANFAYIKATDGGDHLDPMFKTNWRLAKEAGMKRGAYHFFYWCRTAGEQADWFIRNVPRDPDALPPVIDVEWNGESNCKARLTRAQVLAKMQVFLDKVERHYGQRPIIYTAPDFYKDNLSGELLNYPFWLRAVAEHPSKVYPGRNWFFWQYSGSGLSHGVEGKVDLNVFHGSVEQWHNWISPRTALAQN